MKKGLYIFLLIFSMIMSIGGIGMIIDGGDVFDVIILIMFICLMIFSIAKINKFSQNSKNTTKENTSNKNVEQQSEDLDEGIASQDNATEDAYKELEKQNEMLKMKLNLKENYIQKLEEKENTKVLDEDTTKNDDDKENTRLPDQDTSNNDEDLVVEANPPINDERVLDLSYTKAKKLTPDFVVLDFETTGLDYKEDEIIQFGVVEYQEGKVVDEYSKYFKPNKPVGKTVMRKTGITNDFLEDKPKISKEDLEELKKLLEEKTIVAHNAPFDLKYLLKNLHDFNINHKKFRVFDTLTHSRRLIKETPNHKLETLKNYFDLDDGLSHNALNDCRATGNLALLLINRMNN
ncbi:3'-5' exonuclease [Staphylococcus saprophyticus]|uniref:3'-5' exonuclease n=1 Tax=Staphylococcus saprophyticus TaxID=29385 RepID=UPI002DBE1AA0|nr:3'-5' exonuclease [Staphylococcus saprophyticus]MEB8089562.1 3'-5' exonuclease [Staphylococcus saprophyticus]